MNPRGDFVAGWSRSGSASPGVFGKVYNANGSAKTREFRIDSRPADGTFGVRLAMMDDGSFVAGLLSNGAPMARRFTAQGQPLGGSFAVAPSLANGMDVATRGDGSFVVSWIGPFPGIFVRSFGANGQPRGPEVRVVEASSGLGRVAVQPDGSFLVVWVQIETTGPALFDRSMQGRFFEPDGTPAGEAFLISERRPGETFPVTGYDVTVDGDGDFVVSWLVGTTASTPLTTFIRRYAPDHSPLGEAVPAGHRPAGQLTAAAPRDLFVSLWQTAANPATITVRQLTAEGQAAGPLTVLGKVPGGPLATPDLAGNGAGSFVAGWIGKPGQGEGSVVYLRRFQTEE